MILPGWRATRLEAVVMRGDVRIELRVVVGHESATWIALAGGRMLATGTCTGTNATDLAQERAQSWAQQLRVEVPA